MKNSKPKPGQVYAVPLSLNKFGLIQIIRTSERSAIFMAGFEWCAEDLGVVSQDLIASVPIIYLGNFFEALVKIGHWKLVGEFPVRLVPFPSYRILISGSWFIESWDKSSLVKVPIEVAERFPFRDEHGPKGLENALAYHFGFIELDVYLKKNLPNFAFSYVQELSLKQK
jgi:hypothetical protein